jgi:dienelactone hydrolase
MTILPIMDAVRRPVLVLILVAGALWAILPYVWALALVIDLSGQDTPIRRWLPAPLAQVTSRDLEVPSRHGPIPARLYSPDTPARRFWIVVPGVHAGGVDEPRLARLAERLGADGITVLSLPLPDLRNYRILGRATDMLEDAIGWAAGDPGLAPTGRVSLVGVSFGGGLALAAAGRPGVAGRIDQVVSFGGHGDLPRTITYLCTGRLPDGTVQPAHDYGLAILLLAALPHLVPADQAAPLEAAVRTFLEASIADGEGRDEAAELFARARALGDGLPEPARAIMADVSARDATRLGPRLLDYAEIVGGNPALSPERSPLPSARIVLIHGARDTVIPQTETLSLAAHYRARGVPVTALVTPAVSHADPSTQIGAADVWRLVRLWRMIGG